MEKRFVESSKEEQNYVISIGQFQCCPEEFKKIRSPSHFPALGIFKVHEGHPLRIAGGGNYRITVYPELLKDDKRFPLDIYRGGQPEHDFAMFLLFSADVHMKNGNVSPRFFEKVAVIDDLFFTETGKNEISVVYCPRGAYIDDIMFAAPTTESQLWHFMYNCFFHNVWSIHSFDRQKFKWNTEGRIIIPDDEAVDLTKGLYDNIIKKRFGIEERLI